MIRKYCWTLLGIVLCMALVSAPASAQLGFDADPGLLEFNVNYALAETGAGEAIDGWGFGINFESVQARGRFSLGARFASLGANNDQGDLYYHSMPIYLVVKLYLGNPTSRFLGFVGFGPGVSFNRLETRTDVGMFADQKTGFGLGIPLGVTAAITENAYLTAGYSFHIVGGSFFDNDVAHAFAFGLGFKM